MGEPAQVGAMLRQWRQRRRLSQLDLACEANVSSRHLSFIETGRSQPSREMIMQLSERLRIPLRERNALLTAGGYAQVFPERTLEDPALKGIQDAVELILSGHEPYPALAIDRHWTMVAANRSVAPLLAGVDPELVRPPVNVLRLSLHPAGLAPAIVNLKQWRAHLLHRLDQQIDATADPGLIELLKELRGLPAPEPPYTASCAHEDEFAGIAVPLRLSVAGEVVNLISTTMVFGTPLDVMLSELAIEVFFPADEGSGEILRRVTTA